MAEGNYLIDEDDGSDWRSPKHREQAEQDYEYVPEEEEDKIETHNELKINTKNGA